MHFLFVVKNQSTVKENTSELISFIYITICDMSCWLWNCGKKLQKQQLTVMSQLFKDCVQCINFILTCDTFP